jgi:hypothetical protein
LRKIRTRSWILGTFGAISFCLMVVGGVLAPRSRPVGPYEELSGVVVSSQLAATSRFSSTEVFVTVELADGTSALATIASGRTLAAGTPVTVRRYRQKHGPPDHEVVAVRSAPGPN